MPTFTYDNESLRAGPPGSHGNARGGVSPPPGRAALGPSHLLGRRRRRRRGRAARRARAGGSDRHRQPARTARRREAATSSCSASATRRTPPSTWASSRPARRTWTSRSTPTGPRMGPIASPGAAGLSGRSSGRCASEQAIRDGKVGRALAQLVPGAAVIDATVELLRADPTALLCTDPGCYRCSRARARLAARAARARAAAAGRGRSAPRSCRAAPAAASSLRSGR